ncbi:MAG: hypothetical protein JW720_11835 [Sedimentisphaerales bacterium]|nr:hypothetical protein [Sedimentisphaerales bacterium]
MVKCYDKGINVIKEAFSQTRKGLICTPYYSERGLQTLDRFFETAEEVEFWTRFSPLDWRAGVADMAALRRRVEVVLGRGKAFTFRVSDDLHAKIYSPSDDRVILGSANLTWPGMNSNIEVVVELTENEAETFSAALSLIREKLTPVRAETFSAYVGVVADAVSKPFDGPAEEDAGMNAAIELAEEELSKALRKTAPRVTDFPLVEIEKFIDFCSEENSVVSCEIIARHKGKHSLQGHVKHCFYGSLRFLSEHRDVVGEIARTPEDSLYDLGKSSVCTEWRDFLRKHANEIDEKRAFRFRTLRVYLPPTYGGICTGGGGGSSTLKRVLPVVARMMKASRKRND